MLLVRRVEGPTTARVGEQVTYRATEFNRVNPTETERRGINWLIQSDAEELRRELGAGDTITFEIPDQLAGKTIVAMPYANQPTRAISAITLVQPAPERVLHEQFDALRRDFADILGENVADFPDRELVERIKSLKFALDDLLDVLGPLGQNDEGDAEATPSISDDAKRLAIIVGHTERRPGARALPPIDQHEYPFNKEVARRMQAVAANRGIAARTFFRDDVGIRGAYQTAVGFEPDAIVELHFNAATPAARGTETLCSELNPGSRRLADLVQDSMVRVFARGGSTNRGVKVRREGERGFVNVSAAPSVPSILVEPFFGSNEDECRLAAEKTREYAEGLVEAFATFTG